MDYAKLKEVIAKVIKENGQGDITGPALQMVLMTMVNSLGEVYPQTYTKEQKAQARANIDALANYDGEITEEKLSAEVQAILNDVANKQNITDEGLATIAKTIVGAINEVYKGGLEDGSIATSKIEDGAVTADKIADAAVTEDKLASQSVSSKKIKDATIGASKLGAKSVTELKLNDALTAKVNNNVKTVEQTLTDDEVDIASKNLKFRNISGTFFADRTSYDKVSGPQSGTSPRKSIFGVNCTGNKFSGDFHRNIVGNNCNNNIFGDGFWYNILGNKCSYNTFGNRCVSNLLGNECINNYFGTFLYKSKFGNGVSYVRLLSNATQHNPLQNIHILSGVRGESSTNLLAISIPDEYLNSSRELIITTKVTNGGPSTPEDIVMYYADEVVDKQNKQDTTLETTSKEVVGAINELFNGGVKDGSIATNKIEDGAVTNAKIADYSIGMGKLIKAFQGNPDLSLSVFHKMKVSLSGYGQTGSYTMESNGVTKTSSNALAAVDTMTRTLGAAVSLWIFEPKDEEGHTNAYLGIITSVNMPSTEITAIVRHYGTRKDYFVVIRNYEFITKICLTDQLPKIASLETDVTSLLGKVGMNVKVLPKGTNLLSADLEDGIWLVTDPNSYTNPPSWFSGNGIAVLVVNKTSDNVILLGHDSSSNELPAWASRFLSSTSGWRGAGKRLEEIFAKKSEIGIKKLPKNTDLYDDTAIENGILYTLYVDYYGNPHPFYTHFPEKMSNGRPALLFRVDDKVCIIGADIEKNFPFYAWRNVGELKMWSYTAIADQFNYTLQVGSYLSDTEINNIWANN